MRDYFENETLVVGVLLLMMRRRLLGDTTERFANSSCLKSTGPDAQVVEESPRPAPSNQAGIEGASSEATQSAARRHAVNLLVRAVERAPTQTAMTRHVAG